MNDFPGDVRGHRRRRAQRERDLEAELDAHLDLETLDGIDRGLEPEAARLAAQRTLGSRSAIQDHVRDVWRWALVGQMWQDMRYAVRTLRRTPLWTAAALIALGLGIGANAAIFSLADALLFRPLAIAAPGRLLTISTATPESTAEGLSYREFDDLRRRAIGAATAIGYRLAMVGVATSSDSLPQMRMSMAVTRDFFQTLGVMPAVGRAFLPAEAETPGADGVAVLSHDFWQSAFDGDRHIVGRAIRVSQKLVTVVGVAPESFTGMHPVMRPAIYVPLTLTLPASTSEPDPVQERGQRILTVKARLRDGTSRATCGSAGWARHHPRACLSDDQRPADVRRSLRATGTCCGDTGADRAGRSARRVESVLVLGHRVRQCRQPALLARVGARGRARSRSGSRSDAAGSGSSGSC